MTRATLTQPTVDPKTFRRTLGNFATGVTVVTAGLPCGKRTGVTANSFNSVSLDPPLVLWSLDKRSGSWNIFRDSDNFAINILASDQIALSNQFARPNADKFAGISVMEGHPGCLILGGCAATFQCEKHQVVDAGDHWILIGKVLEFEDHGRTPLLYHQGAYSMVLPHPHGTRSQAIEPAADTGYQPRLRENFYYLMTQAVRRYQESYQPEQAKHGWRSGEARLLMVLDEVNPIQFSDLAREADMSYEEIGCIVALFRERGLVLETKQGICLSATGTTAAKGVWKLAQEKQQRVFGQFTDAQIHAFRTILESIIDSQPLP